MKKHRREALPKIFLEALLVFHYLTVYVFHSKNKKWGT